MNVSQMMKQQPVCEKLLPITDANLSTNNVTKDYLYEPDPTSVLEGLIRRYIESVVYQCVADNMASEQAARMVAMKNATDKSKEVVKTLTTKYNKARQEAITAEVSEITAGVEAMK